MKITPISFNQNFRNSNKSLLSLAKEFGVSKKLVLLVKQEKVWGWV